MDKISNIFSTFTIFVTNGFTASLFFSALVWPNSASEKILTIAMMTFLLEFLAVHSNALLSTIKQDIKLRTGADKRSRLMFLLILVSIYSLLAIGFSIAISSVLPGLIFSISLLGKFVGARNTSISQRKIALTSASVFIVTTIFGAVTASMWGSVFPDAISLATSIPEDPGRFEEFPQAMLATLSIYYTLLIPIEIAVLWKPSSIQIPVSPSL